MIESIASIKAIMMLFVVWGHSCIVYTGWWSAFPPAETSVFFSFLTKWFDTFHTYCFVFVSGALYYYLRYEVKKYDNSAQIIRRKIHRLIRPYFITSLLWALPVKLLISGENTRGIVSGYLLGERADQLWFLPMLFWVFVLSCLLCDWVDVSRCSRRKALLLIGGGYALYLVSILLNAAGVPGYYQWISALTYELYFILGMLIMVPLSRPLLKK